MTDKKDVPWTVNVEKLSGKRSYRTMLRVGAQGFELASVQDDKEALEHCRFIQQMFVRAMAALGAPKPKSAKVVPNPERVVHRHTNEVLMASRAFEESAENRKVLDKLVRERRKNIQAAISRIDGLRPEPAQKPRRKSR